MNEEYTDKSRVAAPSNGRRYGLVSNIRHSCMRDIRTVAEGSSGTCHIRERPSSEEMANMAGDVEPMFGGHTWTHHTLRLFDGRGPFSGSALGECHLVYQDTRAWYLSKLLSFASGSDKSAAR